MRPGEAKRGNGRLRGGEEETKAGRLKQGTAVALTAKRISASTA